MKHLFCKTFTPIFSTPHFSTHFSTDPALHVDESGLYRPLECILFPGTPITFFTDNEVEVPSYAPGRFFTDPRLLCEMEIPQLPFPKREEVMEKLHECLGMKYVWGGNDPGGISTFCALHGYTGNFFSGVDCSGLLYYALNGYLPRNTSQLLTFGEEVPLDEVQPLDICVRKGHVLIFLSKERVIESAAHKGVIVSDAEERLQSERGFVIRRIFQSAVERFFKTTDMKV